MKEVDDKPPESPVAAGDTMSRPGACQLTCSRALRALFAPMPTNGLLQAADGRRGELSQGRLALGEVIVQKRQLMATFDDTASQTQLL